MIRVQRLMKKLTFYRDCLLKNCRKIYSLFMVNFMKRSIGSKSSGLIATA